MAARNKTWADPMGAHARLYWSIIDSPAWLALGWAAQGIYCAMRRQLISSNNGNISATLSVLRHRGVKSSSTLASALRALEAVGLIAKTRQGHIAAGARVCNLYRFTDQPVNDFPKLGIGRLRATHEWKAWPSIKAASAAIREADALARRAKDENTSKLRKSNRANSQIEAMTSSKSEHGGASSVRILKQSKIVAIGR